MKRALSWLWIMIWLGASLASLRFPARWFDPRLERSLLPPSQAHVLGLDPLGRDLLAVLLRASAASMGFALGASLLATLIALALGTTIALGPAWLRAALNRALEALLAFPSLLLALAIAAIRGPGWTTLFFSLLIGIFPGFTRLVSARARELQAEPFVLAAEAMGANLFRIAVHHLAPELLALARIKAPFLFAGALLAEATLSFLGLGAPIGHESWGSLLAAGKDYLFEAPHLALASGFPLVLTVLAIQSLCGGERTA